MTRTPLGLTLASLALLPVLLAARAHHTGGWAVITVEALPDHVVAGEPVTLAYTVRQHGVTLLGDLTGGEVTARAGDREVRAAPAAQGERGRYAATLTLPRSGDWTITIRSGFMNSQLTLLPLTAIASRGAAHAPLPDAERGRRLFVAKGCGTCHVRGELGGTLAVGPELTGRRYPAASLATFLADPSVATPATAALARQSRGGMMPNLHLTRTEIASLVAFLDAPGQVSGR
jgi:mono/diheme cytochrome c family protein